MAQLLFIALGGALGAVARYSMSMALNGRFHDHFPYGTLLVNVLGSLLIGVMYVVITERLVLHPSWRDIFIVGFLGAFTTFSTFSLETVLLIENGHVATAMIYSLSSLLCCVAAAWIAIVLTRMV